MRALAPEVRRLKAPQLFQTEGASRKDVFERGVLLALIPSFPLLLLGIAWVVALWSKWAWMLRALDTFPQGNRFLIAFWMLWGLWGVVMEILALRNLARTIRGLNPMSVAAALMTPVALLLLFLSASFAVISYGALWYPGVRLLP